MSVADSRKSKYWLFSLRLPRHYAFLVRLVFFFCHLYLRGRHSVSKKCPEAEKGVHKCASIVLQVAEILSEAYDCATVSQQETGLALVILLGVPRDLNSTNRSVNRWKIDGITSALGSRGLNRAVLFLERAQTLLLMVGQRSAWAITVQTFIIIANLSSQSDPGETHCKRVWYYFEGAKSLLRLVLDTTRECAHTITEGSRLQCQSIEWTCQPCRRKPIQTHAFLKECTSYIKFFRSRLTVLVLADCSKYFVPSARLVRLDSNSVCASKLVVFHGLKK